MSYANKYPTVSEHAGIQAKYLEMRRNGESHNIAEMLATRITPGLAGTERSFFQGHCNGSQFADEKRTAPGIPTVGEKIRSKAVAAGVDTTGAVYIGGLAAFPGDPKAWVKDTGDIKRVLKERNWSAQGSVNYQGHEVAPSPSVAIGDDIVESHVMAEIEKNPGKAAKVSQVREEVRERITPEWKKKSG